MRHRAATREHATATTSTATPRNGATTTTTQRPAKRIYQCEGSRASATMVASDADTFRRDRKGEVIAARRSTWRQNTHDEQNKTLRTMRAVPIR
eukprot:6130654-Prymnesium_polylepis.2